MKRLLIFALAAVMTLGFAACSAPDTTEPSGGASGPSHWNDDAGSSSGGNVSDNPNDYFDQDASQPGAEYDDNDSPGGNGDGHGENYVYGSVAEQPFVNVADKASSYFSLNRNTATYSMVRSQITKGLKINPNSVRIEELINYFDYDFPAPTDEAVCVSTYLADCPWNGEDKLMLAGIKTTEATLEGVNGNYVFLIDVSGSMYGDKRLGLAKKGLKTLLAGLDGNDVVSIVTYASGVNTVLDGAECTNEGKERIINAIDGLKAGGATYGSGGLTQAYEVAENNYVAGGNNRVIVISDGDFNVGVSSTEQMLELISARTVAEKSVYLSVIGVGMGNLRDDMLETMARHGNGNYAYLDDETEVEKVFCHDLKGTLTTVAKDAKAGVTFTENVLKYRLIGYDTLIISKDEFDDKTTDAGEIGSNLCVAALYEIQLAEGAEGKLAEVEIRYKDVRGQEEIDTSALAEVTTSTLGSDDLSFIACVAEFGLVLRQSEYAQNANLNSVISRLEDLNEYVGKDSYRSSFATLVSWTDKLYNTETK